jgi:hypothetical protein
MTVPASAAGAEFSVHAEGVARPVAAGPIYVKARTGTDSDGDGFDDAAILRLQCDGPRLVAAALRHEVVTARDAGSGVATGRRKGTTVVVKEWGAMTPQFRTLLPRIRIAPVPSAGVGHDGWIPVTLADADGICPAADTAVRAATARSVRSISTD